MVLAGGIGAALAFFFDPDRGRYRRNQARDRLAGLFHRASRQVERQARFRSAEIAGAGKRLTHLRPENAAPDDVTLAQRVQSEVFRNPAVPQGRLNINVEDGVVVLRGQLDRPDQISSLEEAVRQVPGVNGVKSLLHLPGSGQQRSA
jgi:osmotically-inducible protein OsmY